VTEKKTDHGCSFPTGIGQDFGTSPEPKPAREGRHRTGPKYVQEVLDNARKKSRSSALLLLLGPWSAMARVRRRWRFCRVM
jgi:hypothetical protein